jgi:serine/threonine protein kinase
MRGKQKPRPSAPGSEGVETVNYELVEKRCKELGWFVRDLPEKVRMAPHTLRRIQRGEPVRPHTVRALSRALKIDPASLVVGKQPTLTSVKISSPLESMTSGVLAEWEVEKVLTEWIKATNGLQYRVCLLRHRFQQNAWGRGKCYELAHLSTRERERIREHLTRHPRICDELSPHPQIPVNKRSFPDESGNVWWVIDKWVPGKTLEETLASGPLPPSTLPQVLGEIALGLQALHEATIIRRELSPRSVWLCESDNAVLLTDFELGKLFDGSPTVSNEWRDDPYRAPEVSAGSATIDVRADLYSWGRILVRATTGALPDRGTESAALASASLPRAVSDITRRCVALPQSERPNSIEEVLAAVRGWE